MLFGADTLCVASPVTRAGSDGGTSTGRFIAGDGGVGAAAGVVWPVYADAAFAAPPPAINLAAPFPIRYGMKTMEHAPIPMAGKIHQMGMPLARRPISALLPWTPMPLAVS